MEQNQKNRKRGKPKLRPIIIVDTQEHVHRHPFTFYEFPTEVAHLYTGDYTIKGLEHLIAVERKTLQDFLGCVGRERDRFTRELARMRGHRFRLLVIEATAAQLEQGDWLGKIQPAHVLGSLAAWTAQYDLPVWLGGTHDAAGRFVERYLYQCARRVALELGAVLDDEK